MRELEIIADLVMAVSSLKVAVVTPAKKFGWLM